MKAKHSKMRTEKARSRLIPQSALPLSCPDASDLWKMHPRVYLPIEKTGQVICPYCGTHYFLQHD